MSLIGSNDFNIDSISFSEMLKDFLLYGKDGDMLAFFIGVHIDEKTLLKTFAFWSSMEFFFST